MSTHSNTRTCTFAALFIWLSTDWLSNWFVTINIESLLSSQQYHQFRRIFLKFKDYSIVAYTKPNWNRRKGKEEGRKSNVSLERYAVNKKPMSRSKSRSLAQNRAPEKVSQGWCVLCSVGASWIYYRERERIPLCATIYERLFIALVIALLIPAVVQVAMDTRLHWPTYIYIRIRDIAVADVVSMFLCLSYWCAALMLRVT